MCANISFKKNIFNTRSASKYLDGLLECSNLHIRWGVIFLAKNLVIKKKLPCSGMVWEGVKNRKYNNQKNNIKYKSKSESDLAETSDNSALSKKNNCRKNRERWELSKRPYCWVSYISLFHYRWPTPRSHFLKKQGVSSEN